MSTSSMMRVHFSSDDKAFMAFSDLVICTPKERNLVALSVAGIDSAVKGFAALSHSNHSKLLWFEDPDKVADLSVLGSGRSVEIDGRQRFRSMTSKLAGGSTHAIILAVDAVAETESEEPVVIAWDGDMDRAFLETLIAKFSIPLRSEWSSYLFEECQNEGYIRELTVISTLKTVSAIQLKMNEEELANLIKRGFQMGILFISEGVGSGGNLREIKNVTEYLSSYGTALAERLSEVFQPHHVPGDPLPPKINTLIRKPFIAQADVAYGITKALSAKINTVSKGDYGLSYLCVNKTGIVVGEMGCGKTMVALVAAHLLHGDNYRVLIQAPGHLIKKWKREVEITIPGAKATILNDYKDVLKLREKIGTKPNGPEFYVISRDRAKLGYFLKTAAIWKSRKTTKLDYGGGWTCPDCATTLLDGEGVPLPFESMLKMTEANLKCPNCKAKLWSADNARVKRMAPVDIFKKYFNGFFDLFVPDEVHERAPRSA
jgi:SNF2 family N-terminal domain.